MIYHGNKGEVKMQETDLAWAAGFLDGEGYISVSRVSSATRTRDYYTALVSVTQVRPAPLYKLQRMFGGKVSMRPSKYFHNGTKTLYGNHFEWKMNGEFAFNVLTAILPYLVLKGRQAELVIELHSLALNKHKKDAAIHRLTPEAHTRKAEIYKELLGLNAKRKPLHAERLNEAAPQESVDDVIVRACENIQSRELAGN